ncbi:MAG: lipid II:glycine glycyltransferase FemX [Anaerorhabdus sp.]|uniref:lipid II:glycine glycyltransferase FemX n=1 Tax=Anaerorhabdus sp. TaxID=1872524 RepID=UPI003A8592D6
MKLENNLNRIQFDDFVQHHELNHYMKTSMWASMQESNTMSFLVGFKEEDNLVGTALVLKKKWMNKSYLYIPWGPCVDYHNCSRFRECLELLKQFTKSEKCFMLRIDFNILRISRDIDGNQIEGIDNENSTEIIKECGFQHKGYGYAYNGSWVNRYTLITDISKPLEEIFKAYAKPRQTAIKRHQIIGVTTRLGTSADLDSLCEFEKELTESQGFKPHSKAYFNQLLTSFKEHARLYITEISLATMIQGLSDEINSKKYAKDKEASASKQKEIENALMLQKKYGDTVIIAAGLFLYFGNKSWDLYTYNKKEFGFVKPVDNLHYFAMQDMKKQGVIYYDMCGFSGVTNKDDPYYGLYNYKKTFGSEFTEFIGEFDYILNEKDTLNFKKQYRFISRFKRKYHTLRYKK